MPFGMKNVAWAFQRLMGTVFQNVECVFVYLDDILFASSSYKEHLNDQQTVCQRFTTFVLTIRVDKCLRCQLHTVSWSPDHSKRLCDTSL